MEGLSRLSKHCKELGNIEIHKKEYADAISHYTKGLSISSKDIDLLSNRALAYLHLGCYNCALSDVEAVLDLNPNHEKCHYRKVKVLWGLGRYQEALDYMETKIPNAIVTQPDFETLILKGHKMLEQSKGNFHIHDLMTFTRDKVNEVGEYTGPVEITPIPGKGRGLLATSDIQPGQLIICSKAFALLFDDPSRLQAIGDTRDYCVGLICQKLSLEPSLREKFFDLYPGPSDEIPEISKTDQGEISKTEVGLVDSIVVYNGFSGEMDLSPWTEVTPAFLGVWILPSYMNHSCMDATAYYYIYGDVMVVRAVKEIKKGQEVTIAYTPPGSPARQEYIQLREFTCDCRLCRMDTLESPQVKKEVESKLELIRAGLGTSDFGVQVSRIREIISVREAHPETNLALLDPCVEMVCSQLTDEGEWEIFAEIFEKCHKVAGNSCYAMSAVYISINLVRCFLALDKESEILKWTRELKKDLVISFGSVEALKYIETEICNELRDQRDIQFFENVHDVINP